VNCDIALRAEVRDDGRDRTLGHPERGGHGTYCVNWTRVQIDQDRPMVGQ
jgi:hypothetical protein